MVKEILYTLLLSSSDNFPDDATFYKAFDFTLIMQATYCTVHAKNLRNMINNFNDSIACWNRIIIFLLQIIQNLNRVNVYRVNLQNFSI